MVKKSWKNQEFEKFWKKKTWNLEVKSLNLKF